MKPLRTFFVEPPLPDRLAVLNEMAHNVRWTWRAEMRELFRRADRDLWESSGHNPVRMLGEIAPSRYAELAGSEAFLAELDRVEADFREYMAGENSWFRGEHPDVEGPVVAYFSAEFGAADSIPIFSGGLGVLAGDHLKSASDMGLPILGIGLLYQHGYFRQRLDPEGLQQETYPVNDFHTMPISRAAGPDGNHLTVEIPFPGRVVSAWVWSADVGRCKLFLLDTNHPDNSDEDREITSQLYGGDQETRIRQEIVLGMGGVRMLAGLGLEPPVLHSNEGHAAFLLLERCRRMMSVHDVPFWAACEATRGSVVFTTHTPVPAGIDVFPAELVRSHFSDYVREVGIGMDELLRLGRVDPEDASSGFNMAVLAVRLGHATNSVSKLHRATSRKMWRGLWPGVPEDAIPIGHVTNGIHISSWISSEMGTLFERYLGPRWRQEPRDSQLWESVDNIPMVELWRTHERRRERLVAFARRKLLKKAKSEGAGAARQKAALEVLDPEALTIGFARRFAPYKRADLLFSDIDRLARLLNDKNRPVQILFSGKAHPQDQLGKELIRKIVAASRRPELASRVVFLEDYDLNIARYLVQGVDVWLNTPRRPLEASGTSGMKAVANGALHLSTRDGWWAEVDSDGLGWTIGGGEEYGEDLHEYGDEVEATALYRLLEQEVIPIFYDRTRDDLPRRWIEMMKRSMKVLCPVFNSNRMVRQYCEQYYLPALEQSRRLLADGLNGARRLAEWKRSVSENWGGLRLAGFEADIGETTVVGAEERVSARLYLANLSPEEISVELVFGRIGPDSHIREAGAVSMEPEGKDEEGLTRFSGSIPCTTGGKLGFAIRVLPRHELLPNPYQLGLVTVFED